MKERKCKNCGERLAPDRRTNTLYCNLECKSKSQSRKYHFTNRNSEDYQKMKRGNFKRWYEENKERQIANVKSYYNKNKKRWRIADYNYRNKERILAVLPSYCSVCGKDYARIVCSKTRDILLLKFTEKDNPFKTEEKFQHYVKNYLTNVCSPNCLGMVRRRK